MSDSSDTEVNTERTPLMDTCALDSSLRSTRQEYEDLEGQQARVSSR
jgi:hypothetical protein